MSGCPGFPWHGSGPYPAGKCYSCLKRAALAGDGLPEDLRLFAGFPEPRPRERGWRAADRLRWPDPGPALERLAEYRAPSGLRALAEAIRRIGGDAR